MVLKYLFFTAKPSLTVYPHKGRNIVQKQLVKKGLKKMFNIIGEGVPRKCENYKHLSTIEYADFVLFIKTEIFICQKCFSNLIATPESIQSTKNFFSGFVQPDEE